MQRPKPSCFCPSRRIRETPALKAFRSLAPVRFTTVAESDLVVDDFAIPEHYPRGYGMDVGWNFTAAVWGALNRETDTLFLYHEYKRSQAEPSVHAHGIKAPGDWIRGFIDPASRGRNQKDGSQLFADYTKLGLKLEIADNGVESGLFSVWNRMSTGRLKVFRSLGGWLKEFRLYRRDQDGKVVKQDDHLMDATRYLESRISTMRTKRPTGPKEPRWVNLGMGAPEQNWMM